MHSDLRRSLHKKVIDHLDTRNTGLSTGDEEKWRASADDCLRAEMKHLALPDLEKERLRGGILDEIFAYGPITCFLEDPAVSEIMANGKDSIYVEREGNISPSGVAFISDETLRSTIDRMVARVNRRLDESSPFVDARLPDGSRVNAIIPPVSLSGPCLTIRKFRKAPYSLEELIRIGTVTEDAAAYLREAVSRRMNMIISGGTGSGKTTLLNALSQFIPDRERIITIEDAAEIRLMKPHVVRLEARPPNIEGAGAITIRDLVRNSLRMRPDRIVVGECRGGEALDMLQAMNTGHDGSITTGHANSPRDMLRRLETMVLLSGVEIPVRAIREQIASAIDVIVHISRTGDGKRSVHTISEVTGMGEMQILLQEIFRLSRSEGTAGKACLAPTGVPSKLHQEEENGWT
ncbi:MAG: T2SP E protein [Actinobacteria bacterium]|nr:T2SP E protein [Actinomycetota bacterium]MBM2828374.1 type secretion system protein [Actinomycetota bacterium]